MAPGVSIKFKFKNFYTSSLPGANLMLIAFVRSSSMLSSSWALIFRLATVPVNSNSLSASVWFTVVYVSNDAKIPDMIFGPSVGFSPLAYQIV